MGQPTGVSEKVQIVKGFEVIFSCLFKIRAYDIISLLCIPDVDVDHDRGYYILIVHDTS